MNTTRRTVRYTVGWKITKADERAIGPPVHETGCTMVTEGSTPCGRYLTGHLDQLRYDTALD
ncbi:hypothetical protein [Streptomyces sp. NPDC102462]|uniref:hypothetical protein n=1 Tax=Streptomyces sp. NPDC102462 TaxID=3366178 RepID=UPI0037FA3DAB